MRRGRYGSKDVDTLSTIKEKDPTGEGTDVEVWVERIGSFRTILS